MKDTIKGVLYATALAFYCVVIAVGIVKFLKWAL